MDKYVNGFAEQAAILQSIQAGIRDQIRAAHIMKTFHLAHARLRKEDCKVNARHYAHNTFNNVRNHHYKEADKHTDKIKRLERNLKWVKEAIREVHFMEVKDNLINEVD
jgi:hypothetical protein